MPFFLELATRKLSLYLWTFFAVLWSQNHICRADKVSYSDHPHPHKHGNPHHGNVACPPHIVSSAEEVAHYCHQMGRSHFQVHNATYQCWGIQDQNLLCQGVVHHDKKLLTCSQPEIDSCGDEAIYANFNDDSHGPCLFRGHDLMAHSSRCGNGAFACWDPTLKDWCGGTVLTEDEPEPTPTCPPPVVSSIDEATHYCVKDGLATTHTRSDDSFSYACYWKNGTTACKGTIDPKHNKAPTCSATIETCDDLMTVCNGDYSNVVACSEGDDSKFECWDRVAHQWCEGQVVSASRTNEKAYPRSDVQGQSLITSNVVLLLTMIVAVGILAERASREKYSHISPHLPVDKFGYQAVTEDMTGQDFELTAFY